MLSQKYDVIIVGSGFAASFFLLAYLQKAKPTERILVLERGFVDSHQWQLENERNSRIDSDATFVNNHAQKSWRFNIGFGGGSNCWWAVTPRFMPNDFKLRSVYGVGEDWPISYDELESYYHQAEEVMAISGPSDGSPFPRSRPYPQPPHRLTKAEEVLKAAYPTLYFVQPTARARIPTANRSGCCGTGVCGRCPVNAKFTIQNEMFYLYEEPRITLELGATVQIIETVGGVATGVLYLQDCIIKQAQGELLVLATNALFNPHILLRSGFSHPLLGKRLHEQVSVNVTIDLDGLNNYYGSTSLTGHGYMLYDGEHRKERAACLTEWFNIPYGNLRHERGKWLQRARMKFIFEDLPSERNYVTVNQNDPTLPEVVYEGHSDYTQKGIDALPELLPQVLAPLPIENIHIQDKISQTDYHIQGTTMMGNNPEHSVVDRYLRHHHVRNLLVLGSSVFPSCSPANPTLTLSALSLWAVNHL